MKTMERVHPKLPDQFVFIKEIALSKGPRKHMATDLETLKLRPYRLELLGDA